jgi:hypothetical protein
MPYWICEYLLFALFFAIFALAGGWLLVPFKKNRPYIFLATPMAGWIALSALTILIYCACVPFQIAAVLAWIALSLLTLASVIPLLKKSWPKQLSFCLPFLFALSLGGFYIENYASLKNSSPSILLMDGSDQLGYTYPSTWLIHHPLNAIPQLSPDNPYESWPNLELIAL